MQPSKLCYPRNPEFGSGVCRRLIRVVAEPGQVHAELSDNFHEMRCRILHDGQVVSGIRGETVRVPTSGCSAAVAILQDLVVTSLDEPKSKFYEGGKALHHCTHLFDLCVISIRHARLAPHVVNYEAVVPDEADGPVWIQVKRDGNLVHRWQVRNGIVIMPRQLRGKALGKGFARWAAGMFDEDDLEAATILARTWLIAIGRQYLVEMAAGQSVIQNSEMLDRCFAYATERAQRNVFNSGHVRDASRVVLPTD